LKKSILASFAFTFLLASCGGGGGSAPSPIATTAPQASQTVSTQGQTAGQAFVVPLSSNVAAQAGVTSTSITLPVALPANTQVSANAGQPSNILVAFDAARSTSSIRTFSAGIPNAVARLYYVITPPATVTMSGDYSFSMTLADAPLSDAKYYIAAFDGTQWIGNATGSAATVSGNNLTFSGTFPLTLNLAANHSYAFVVYTLPLTANANLTTSTSTTNPVQVNGIIDGSVTLSLPAATAAVGMNYVSTQILPTNVPDLAHVSGVREVDGYVTITPTQDVTFVAGQKVVLTHPYLPNQHDSNANTSTGSTSTAIGGTTDVAGNTVSSSPTASPNSDDSTPLIAVYDPTLTNPTWALGFGTYALNGNVESLTYTLPANMTLKANTTYTFGVYNT
jgi:hypothetical protein